MKITEKRKEKRKCLLAYSTGGIFRYGDNYYLDVNVVHPDDDRSDIGVREARWLAINIIGHGKIWLPGCTEIEPVPNEDVEIVIYD